MKIINKILALILTLFGIFFLTGCNSKNESEEKIESIQEESPDDSQLDISNETSEQQKLTLDTNKCIGCGKCARIAPSNFEMDNRKADVISQENLESENVQQAIKNCPINIIKVS